MLSRPREYVGRSHFMSRSARTQAFGLADLVLTVTRPVEPSRARAESGITRRRLNSEVGGRGSED